MPAPPLAPRPAVVLLAVAFALAACADRADPDVPDDPDCCAVQEPLPTFRGSFDPVDDGASVPGFSRFRDTLRSAIARRDTAGLLALVAPGARLGYDTDLAGPEGVRALWFTGSAPGGQSLWRTLGAVVDAGSVEEDGAVTAPYVYGLWPGEKDPLAHVAIVGSEVEAFAEPVEAEAVARLSYTILPTAGPPEAGWQPVRLPTGETAFVPTSRALRPTGYRAAFWEDGGGRWRLQSFLADE